MTREEALVKAPELMIPQPFAAGDDTHQSAFKPIDNEALTNDVNFVEGFTAAFAAPGSQGGRYVTRNELNAIGHLASVNEFHRQVGGIITFNPTLADKIGGYPMGAILEYLDGLNYYRVVSLADNNTVNFNEVGVDGVNWAYCERGLVDNRIDPIDIATIGTYEVTSPNSHEFFVANFIAQRDGVISFSGNYNFSQASQSTTAGYAYIAVYDTDEDGNIEEDSIKYLVGMGSTSSPISIKRVTKGNAYQLVAILYSAKLEGNGFKAILV